MKKIILLLMFTTLLSLTGCSGTKKTTETTVIKEKEKTSITNTDSVKKTVVNKEIKDVLSTPVSKSDTGNKMFDSIVDAKVREILKKLNTSKQSGDNSYKLTYDELKDLLEVHVTVGETKNDFEKIGSKVSTIETDSQYISEYKEKIKGVPFYWWIILLIIIFRKTIFNIICIFYPPLRLTKIAGIFT